MNNIDSTMTYREQVEAARAPIERGSEKYAELLQKFGQRKDGAGWVKMLEQAKPHELGHAYYLECFQRSEFVGNPPPWADLSITDLATDSAQGLPMAGWGRYLVQSEEVDVELSRRDVYDPDGGVTTEGELEYFVGILGVDGFSLSRKSDLRKIAAALLNAADEADKYIN